MSRLAVRRPTSSCEPRTRARPAVLAVAEGFGPGPASAAAVAALAALDRAVDAGDVLNALADAVENAAAAVRPLGSDTGTTGTALVRAGSRRLSAAMGAAGLTAPVATDFADDDFLTTGARDGDLVLRIGNGFAGYVL